MGYWFCWERGVECEAALVSQNEEGCLHFTSLRSA
jgi:hypothetical protein